MKNTSGGAIALPKFYSSAISKSLNKSALVLQNYRQALDSISSDIKNLELYLQGQGINLHISSPCGDKSGMELSWGPDKKGTFRILFSYYISNDFGDPEYIEMPFIECSLQLRLQNYRFLPKLIDAISNEVALFTAAIEQPKVVQAEYNGNEEDVPF